MIHRGLCSVRVVGWALAIGATVHAWAGSVEKPTENPVPSGVVVVRDLIYRDDDGRRPTLDLYLPAEPAAAARPVILAIHGGSWVGGSKREYGSRAARFAQHGYAVAAVDYQLARPGAPSWDGALRDVLAAVDWLVDHAPTYRIDPGRIVAFGTSSGGLLAAHLAREDLDRRAPSRPIVHRIEAAVCLSTPYSLAESAARRRLNRDPIRDLLGGDPLALAGRAAEASPISHASPGSRPILLIHGVDDLWVSIDQARKMHVRCSEAGVFHRLIEVEGARHGFELQVGGAVPRDLLPDVLDFLKQVESDGRKR